ncbi:MAG TPA: N-acetyltransferase [Sneathiellales bacterium]|nr:N-acetyltransferase [Sneathiellales bacterium]
MTKHIDLAELKNQTFSVLGEILILKVMTSELVEDRYVNWMNDYEITKYTEQKYRSHNRKDVEDFVRTKYQSEADLLFGIFSNKLHVGNIKLGPIDFNHMVSDISYFIGDRSMWGKGISTKVIGTVVEIAFDVVGLEKVTAGVYEKNTSSIVVLEKNGFVLEGVKRSQVLFEGKRIDFAIYGRIKDDVGRVD